MARPRCLALCLLAAMAAFPQSAAAQGQQFVTELSAPHDAGVGAEHRDTVTEAYVAMSREHDLARAGRLLAPVIAYCDEQQRPGPSRATAGRWRSQRPMPGGTPTWSASRSAASVIR